jgi:hypothetical protein
VKLSAQEKIHHEYSIANTCRRQWGGGENGTRSN